MSIPQLVSLRERLVTYAQFVEQMIGKCRHALVERQRSLLDDIVGGDEARANQTEMDLEEQGTSLIAQHQPMAHELRTVLMVLHMTTDLERMADHAVNIAEAVREYIERPSPDPDAEVMRMFEATISMVDNAIRAFIDENASLGQEVCESDAVVDTLATGILVRLSASMSREPSLVPQSLALLKVAANLERIADLSTNIGEDVIYMAEGRVIKHHRQERDEMRA